MPRDEDPILRYGIAGGAAFFLLCGLLMCGAGLRNTWRAARSTGWPQADAVAEWSESDGRVRFRYRVEGREFTTLTRHFGQTETVGDSSEAELWKLRYQKGAHYAVRYDPGNPAVAAAEPGPHSALFWLPGAGLFVMAPGFLMLMFGAQHLGIRRPAVEQAGFQLFAAMFAALGLVGLWFGGSRLWQAQQSLRWPQVPGEIVFQRTEFNPSTDDKLPGESQGPEKKVGSTATNLVYRYEVAGQTYYSNLRRIGQLAGADAKWAAEIAARYPLGARLPVFHDPGDPQRAVLEPGWNWESWFLPGAGLAAFTFGVAVLLALKASSSRPT